ncbi:impB/mucB/samB family protein [Lasiosphaeris hirsuta]|uniref:DNA repair protein REV1 n=1 Tax=Lasiosphaeris hirsuta TaxID=260670 RepID=A0AA40E7V0_9PEZI|nr:impB/mucB/samB family protein [Lasiosphaeris hirsuta]
MGSRLEKGSAAMRKRIEGHAFSDEAGEEYEGSEFGGFGDYFRRKKIKLQNLDVELRAAAPDKPQIFKGIVAHVIGYTQPPLHVLHKDLVQHGAGFLQYLDSKTMATHIIASAMPPKKTVDFTGYRIVRPAWVTDSIQAGRLLPWPDYRVTDEGPRQKTIKFDGGKMVSQNARQSPRGYREQTQSSFYNSQFMKSTAGLNAGEASSPFQPKSSSSKLALVPVGNIEDVVDIDDMDVDFAEPPAVPEQVSLAPSATPDLIGKGAMNTDTTVQIIEPLEPPIVENPEPASGPSKKKALTSEEHNALLLSDPKIRKSSTANPDFLKQFYSESRLHHLSTWKAQLKARMQSLASEKGPAPKAVKRKGSRRYIMHVDFDSFFCAVSLKQAPEYRDKPAVVAHSSGSGSEIASCNYPARKFGVKNGMWMRRALELCPNLKTLPYDFPGYEEASQLFYDAILEVGGVVQSVSIDEALVDITNVVLLATGSDGVGVDEGSIWREQEKADEIATKLREQVKLRTDCHVSVGIGGNILLAKVALRKVKPAGQCQIRPEEVLEILGELNVVDLPGVADSIGGKLEEMGVKLVKDIRQQSKERLVSILGPKTGEKLWEYARGIDRAEVGEQPIRKSVSADVNWGIRFINQEEAEEFVRNLSKELERRLLSEGVKGKHLTMKIMRRAPDAPLDPAKHLGHGECDTFNKSTTFGVATHSGEVIGKEAVSILRSFKFSPGDLRGLGVQMTKLEPLKGHSAAGLEGSQKKLNFNVSTSVRRQISEQIDEDTTPEKKRPAFRKEFDDDPISMDPLTPRKPKIHPALAIAKANAADEKARTPLNITGTQFLIPTNPDPEVLAELPQDIRSKLLGQGKRKSAAQPQSRGKSPGFNSRSQSPALADEIPSDIDPDVFNALPEEMKAEVLVSYGRGRPQARQSIISHSPSKDRVIQRPKEKPWPTKHGAKDMFSGAQERERHNDDEANVTRASIVADDAVPAGSAEDADQEDTDEISDLDVDFLDELPPDVRSEIMSDHRRQRLAQRSGLSFGEPPWRAEDDDDMLPGGQRMLSFLPRPPKLWFMSSVSTSGKDVKDMIILWHQSTQTEGPHRADVESLEKYLGRVITEEQNMEKARRLVKWLGWIIDDGVDGEGKDGWRKALESAKLAVQQAMRERGVGPMEFG